MSKLPQQQIDKLRKAKEFICANVLERDAEAEGILVTLLSESSCLFLGDVGTAKTFQIRLATKLFGLRFFDTLLSETTKPDQIFGPTDVPALARGVQRVKTKGYAPDAEVCFFDEIFKANGIVLNPLLWLINEKQFRNGDEGIIDTPVKAVFAASNELPTDSSLKAIYDRLLLRYQVGYIKNNANIVRMTNNFLARRSKEEIEPLFTVHEIKNLMDLTWEVVVPTEIQQMVLTMRDQIELACGNKISDRRLAQSFHVLQATALLSGRMEVESSDTEILSSMFWDRPDNIIKVRAIALSHASSDVADLLTYSELAENVWDTATKTGDMKKAQSKLENIFNTVKDFKTKTGQLIVEQVRDKVQRVKNILAQRGSLSVLKIVEDKGTWYKVSIASAAAWTADQLRSAGFHHYQKGNYWWCDGAKKGGDAALVSQIEATLGVTPGINEVGE